MNLLLTINENIFEPQDYLLRKVVRLVILNGNNEVLFFGHYLVGGGVEEGETDEDDSFQRRLHNRKTSLAFLKEI